MGKVIRIGTRESQLAVWQATQVQQLLLQYNFQSELVYIKSEGDIDLQTPLYEMGVQGIFTKSLDIALLNNKIDALGGEIRERKRVEESGDQSDFVRDEVGIEAIELLGQHRMAEAIDGVRELGDDRRVDRGVVAVRGQELVHLRLDRAREFLEHEMLVLHLGAELRGLEQAFAVPSQARNICINIPRRDRWKFGQLMGWIQISVEESERGWLLEIGHRR